MSFALAALAAVYLGEHGHPTLALCCWIELVGDVVCSAFKSS